MVSITAYLPGMMDSNAVKRRLRYQRVSTGKRVEPTERDIIWFQMLNRHGPLPSHFLLEFTHELRRSDTRSLERLRDLYHEGNTPHGGPYLDRPPGQWTTLSKFERSIYDNTPCAEQVLFDRGSLERPAAERSVLYHHRLMVACITASIELAIRRDPSLRFIPQQEILARSPNPTLVIPCRTTYTNPRTGVSQTVDTPLIPDALFGIEYAVAGGRAYRFFMLEADRATEPVRRTNLRETSYFRKVLQYREVIGKGGYRTHFGMKSAMLVLTVTTNMRHLQSIMEMTQAVSNGNGTSFFLFAIASEFGDRWRAPDPSDRLLTEPWRRVGLPSLRINQAADAP